jgi:hypothetical protein
MDLPRHGLESGIVHVVVVGEDSLVGWKGTEGSSEGVLLLWLLWLLSSLLALVRVVVVVSQGKHLRSKVAAPSCKRTEPIPLSSLSSALENGRCARDGGWGADYATYLLADKLPIKSSLSV